MITPLAGAGILGLVVGSAAFGLDRLALAAIRPPQRVHRRKLSALSFPAREHSFSSSGQLLRGYIVDPESDGGGAVVVLVHGWGSSKGNLIRLALPLLHAGHPVFLFDVRHHGESPPSRFVTARHYRDDIAAACREMRDIFPQRPLALIGHSMGGACGVLAAADGASVQGLVSISAPADLWEVWAYHFDRLGLPGKWVVRILNPFWRRRAGVPWKALDPTSRARELFLPFLVLHGSEDESVPVKHARALADAAGIEAVVLEGLAHSDLLDSSDLHESVLSFLQELTA